MPEKVIYHPNRPSVSLSISNRVSLFSFLQAQVGRRAALATGSREFFGEWKMSYGETYCPPPPTRPLATRTWHLTPSCVYIRPWKWEIVMSHSGCVFTLRSHARKEISHGLLKVARWERIAAVPQSCSDLAPRARTCFMSSLLQRPPTNRRTATLVTRQSVVEEKATEGSEREVKTDTTSRKYY